MNNQLTVVHQQDVLGQPFKVYGTIEEPLFLAKDVAEWIEYRQDKVGQMVNTVDEDEVITSPIQYSGQVRNMYFLTEDGIYEVLMQSRKPIVILL
ncbi:Bro-N domain-containing protein [Bacillus albus]